MQHKIISLLYVSILLFGCNHSGSYVNPVKTIDQTEIHLADPFVYKHDGIYYMTGTSNLPQGEGFICYKSTNLIVWEYIGELYRKPEKHIGIYGFWAPEVKHYKGKFYMTYSCYVEDRDLMLTCLAVSEKPEGPFVDLYAPWFDLDYSAIDANIFVDDDDTPYIYFSKNGNQDTISTGVLYAARLKKDLSGLDGEPVLVSEASQAWEKVNWENNRCNEGAFVFKQGNTYYMTYSANHTGFESYGVGVSYAKHPLGPWVKSKDNPLLTTNLSKGVSSPGHNSIIETPDKNLYIVYHRHADPNCIKPNYDRIVCIDRLYLDNKGNLRIN
ncbi:beta-xylosidase [Parabacteroides sp. PF5-5]|uniref:glycoside hydrolase family 43 protein n=1 Tax=unclassified Parabacteroides TaxID=2649774 RepID=UPI002473DC12|nr:MULTISPECIES: glycoside hydrolase family 43 protein [unclassified Parabacteroides]MDH6304120.1 beta-xylosidase [Parabacteroides sp. PH5-39]MDH6315180.1 beta-xylosidase [Parabacteroides sp. PF5-13]MDH6318825.1 beta-xylosidase [Parabacteroides sp. PH5-13]MDH6322554.1 beta-xylosidase [Parabacteroides sp. PH5-8]MDH6326294.1 beta-xylosidase [Parabacteroides sp. PH5-41]